MAKTASNFTSAEDVLGDLHRRAALALSYQGLDDLDPRVLLGQPRLEAVGALDDRGDGRMVDDHHLALALVVTGAVRHQRVDE